MDIVVVYDIAGTDDPAGAARLRNLSDVCSAYGHRVQHSVFECRVSPASFVSLQDEISRTIDHTQDNVILYRIVGDMQPNRTSLGVDTEHALGETWVL